MQQSFQGRSHHHNLGVLLIESMGESPERPFTPSFNCYHARFLYRLQQVDLLSELLQNVIGPDFD